MGNYRVLDISDHHREPVVKQFTLVFCEYDETGVYVEASTMPGDINLVEASLDDLRVQIADMHQALERDVLVESDLPGSSNYTDPRQPSLSETDSPVDGFDDGSAPDTPDDGVEGSTDEPGLEPDPDSRHDDPSADERAAAMQAFREGFDSHA